MAGRAADAPVQVGHVVKIGVTGYDDDASLSWFHMSFVPNPSVLSVYFKNVGRSRHRVSVVSAA